MVLCLFLAACTSKEVSFTYSPDTPRAGESIKFTNHTAEGEKWEWNFGDGTSSSSKNPSKIYKKPGTYTVILKVDEKNHRSYSKTITVIDTVPVIELLDDSLVYYQQPTRLHMSAYNPYNNEMSVEWSLGEDATLVKGKLTDNTISVRFTKHSQPVSVSCVLTLGNKTYPCSKEFYVNDTLAPSLMMATADGQLLRQRIFADDVEFPHLCLAGAAVSAVNSMVCEGDYAYLFNGDQSQETGLYAYNLADTREQRILYNAVSGAAQGFFNGCYYQGMLYWTGKDDGHIYHIGPTVTDRAFTGGTTSSQYWGSMTQLGYGLASGSPTTGMQWYNDVAFVCYGGIIYRFTADDRQSGATPAAGAILTDGGVLHFAIDNIAKKVYYLKAQGLYVCNISGDNVRQLADVADGLALCVDNFMNRLYWATADGVFYLPLVQTANNAMQSQPTQLNSVTGVRAMDVDATPRRGQKAN